jgi:7-carboxy-7-deazaguanine synthase
MALSDRALAQTAAQRVAPLRVLDSEPDDDRASSLLVHEVYTSLQGEGTRAGVLCTFVRLTGCHLRCRYCDTEHAFEAGTLRPVDDVVAEVAAAGAPLVQLTGGEPLLQPAAFTLITTLCDAGHEVVIETSGAVSTARVDPRAIIVLDIKTPGSGEQDRNVASNLERLRPHDEVKFVLTDEADYQFAKALLEREQLQARCAAVLFSPVEEPDGSGLNKQLLAGWMVRDRLPARMQVQLHKIIWGDKRGV